MFVVVKQFKSMRAVEEMDLDIFGPFKTKVEADYVCDLVATESCMTTVKEITPIPIGEMNEA